MAHRSLSQDTGRPILAMESTEIAPTAAPVFPQAKAQAGANRTDAIDALLLHRWAGPLVLLLVIVAMFQLVFRVAEPFMGYIENAQALVSAGLEPWLGQGALRSFVIDGVVNGIGSTFVFVPQIALLIGFVTLLESSGYMARAVFLLDRLLRRFGLTGRSFVPLTSSFACAIPGILASRIIADERDRIATIVVSPLMSCSARLPVYVVLLAAFFPSEQAGLLLLALYLLGILAAAQVRQQHHELVARLRHLGQALDLHRDGGAGTVDGLAVLRRLQALRHHLREIILAGIGCPVLPVSVIRGWRDLGLVPDLGRPKKRRDHIDRVSGGPDSQGAHDQEQHNGAQDFQDPHHAARSPLANVEVFPGDLGGRRHVVTHARRPVLRDVTLVVLVP